MGGFGGWQKLIENAEAITLQEPRDLAAAVMRTLQRQIYLY